MITVSMLDYREEEEEVEIFRYRAPVAPRVGDGIATIDRGTWRVIQVWHQTNPDGTFNLIQVDVEPWNPWQRDS